MRPAPSGYNVSSEHSDYAPVARLAVSLPRLQGGIGDTIVVTIDSGLVIVPGPTRGDSIPVMSDLYLTALLAVATSDSGGREESVRAPWRAVAASDSQLVAGALALGERRELRGLVFRLARPPALDPAHAWLVFRISGAAQTTPVVDSEGRFVAPARRVSGGVRVYACADWTLAGYVDRRRARRLAEAYGAAC